MACFGAEGQQAEEIARDGRPLEWLCAPPPRRGDGTQRLELLAEDRKKEDATDAVRNSPSDGNFVASHLANLSGLSVEQFLMIASQAGLTLGKRGIRNARRKLSQNPHVEEMAIHLAKFVLTRTPTSLDIAEALLACLDTKRPDRLARMLGNALLTIAPPGSSVQDVATRKIERTGSAAYLPQPHSALADEIVAVAILTADRTDGGVVRRGMFREIASNPNIKQLAESLVDTAKAGIPLHGPTVNMILMALQRGGFHDAVIQIVGSMVERNLPPMVRYDLNIRRVEALISTRRNDEAEAVIRNELSEPLRLEAWAKLKAWLAAQEHDFERARNIFKTIQNTEYSLAYVDSTGMEPLHQPEQSPDRVKIFLSAFNEAELIENLLNHYRAMTPCTFFVVDNMSEDGTVEYLSRQDDVRLWRTSESFAASGFGSTWINTLIAQHSSLDEYVLRIDADEFFVYPSMEDLSLPDFFRYLKRQGFEAVHGPMIDMYPEYPIYSDGSDLSPGDQTLRESRYFDAIYNELGASVPPYNSGWGGMRNRIFGEATFLTKTVVIRGGGAIRYYNANHYTTPAYFSDVTCALLHYKFTPNSGKRYRTQIERGEHFNGGVRYRRFLNTLSQRAPLIHAGSQVYGGPADLIRTGFMRTSPAYETWVQEHSGRNR